jgi:hypothetical protein
MLEHAVIGRSGLSEVDQISSKKCTRAQEAERSLQQHLEATSSCQTCDTTTPQILAEESQIGQREGA